MKPLNQDELYQNLRGFLKDKGIELQDGSYARGIQKSCSLLSDAINLGQQGLGRAKVEIDKKLDQMRQVVHEKTAPKRPASAAGSGASQAAGARTSSKSAGTTTKSRKRTRARKSR